MTLTLSLLNKLTAHINILKHDLPLGAMIFLPFCVVHSYFYILHCPHVLDPFSDQNSSFFFAIFLPP